MSKNTERGMGHHPGPVADGRPDEMPRAASERPAAASAPAERTEGGPVRPQRSDMGQVTLLGVSVPIIDREKLTAPGRDVHLPAEVRRAPGPRSITGEGGSPAAPAQRRPTPDPPVRAPVNLTPASTVPISKTKIITPVLGNAAPSAYEARGAFPVGRRQPDPAGVPEGIGVNSGVGASVVLGIGLSLVVALIVVGVARFGPHGRTAESLPLQRFEGRPDPRLDSPAVGRPGDTTAAGQLPSVGGDSARAGEAPPAEVPSSAPATTAGAVAQPDSRIPPPVFDEINEARAPNNIAEKNIRRPAGRPRAVTSFGDRGAGSPGAGTTVAPYPRRSPGRQVYGQPGFVGAEGAATPPTGFAPTASPSQFQPPPISSPRPASSKGGDDSKAPYDPDSPLPPATE